MVVVRGGGGCLVCGGERGVCWGGWGGEWVCVEGRGGGGFGWRRGCSGVVLFGVGEVVGCFGWRRGSRGVVLEGGGAVGG